MTPNRAVRDADGRALSLDNFVAVIVDYFELGPGVEGTLRLVEDLAFDSIMMVEVWDFLSDACNEDISEELFLSLRTVEDLYFAYAQSGHTLRSTRPDNRGQIGGA